MKITNSLTLLLLITGVLLLNNCSSSDNPDDNNAPSIFSTNTTYVGFDTATIEWTESLDSDGDTVTYAIIFEGQEVASNLTALTFSFYQLESETSYSGFVESRDGNGGTNRADFFFTTDPDVIISQIRVEEFTFSSTSTACPTTLEIDAGVLVPKYEGDITYNVSFGVLTLNNGNSTVAAVGRTWTNATANPYYIYDYDASHYFVWQAGAGMCATSTTIPTTRAFYASASGQATITISRN